MDGSLAELKLVNYEVREELKKSFKSSELLLIEKQVEQHTVIYVLCRLAGMKSIYVGKVAYASQQVERLDPFYEGGCYP